ncbi:hypothetical protein [Streptomyces celluloflavus]|uniref:hypothetical protein n=1 Tax=Streptomyces celluloflavus TaxID=58344 RepID=UPI00365D4397
MRQAAGSARRAALGSPYGGRAHHIPDFLEPHPAGTEEALDDELHRAATAPAGRIDSEADVDVVRSGSGSGKAAMPDAPRPARFLRMEAGQAGVEHPEAHAARPTRR